jgi:2-dehydro-3-deoxygalactonokinase
MDAMLGLDWGISAFRAYSIGADGAVRRRYASAAGILSVPDGRFEAVLRCEIGRWLKPGLPVVAAGMIGSRQGWREVPYARAPAGVDELAAGLRRLDLADGLAVQFVPGVERLGADGVPDVMRGEETQIVGAGADAGLFVLPGSHSKWARLEAGRIAWFATFMTGEVFAALKGHTILGRLMRGDGGFDAAAFAAGVAYARSEAAESGGLLKRLFSARTLGLFGQLPAEGLSDYLSGLLIGSEVAEALTCIGGGAPAATVAGGEALAQRYVRALALSGLDARAAPPDLAAAGLYRIARAAGLIGGMA